MSLLQTSIYKFVLDLYCTEACLTGFRGAATMEEAIGKFMDGMEAQERGGFKELHRLLARLPVPTVKASQAMNYKNALEGGFLPSMT